MRTGTTRDFPAWLERLCRRFDRWRETRDGRSHIPEALWASAVKAVGKYGLNPTARALRLDYYSLKKRVEAAASCGGPDRQEVVRSAAGKSAASEIRRGGIGRGELIELAPATSACSPECILELEHPGGAKMRVHLTGMPAPDLAALSRSFWSMET
jgi:hypothetical protein